MRTRLAVPSENTPPKAPVETSSSWYPALVTTSPFRFETMFRLTDPDGAMIHAEIVNDSFPASSTSPAESELEPPNHRARPHQPAVSFAPVIVPQLPLPERSDILLGQW